VRATTTAGRGAGRLDLLDALRLFAAVAVVAFHFVGRDSPAWGGRVPESLDGVGRWASYGQLGVPLFFVISGFVLLMSAWGRDVPAFVASRVGRLYPAYWVAVVISAVIVLVLWPENPAQLDLVVTRKDAVLNTTMLQQAFGAVDLDGPYWSLWYELRFYLLIAVFLVLGITRTRVLVFATLWPVLGAMAAESGADLVTTLLLPDYAPFFAGGMLLYLIHRYGHDLGTWLLVGMQVAFGIHLNLERYPQLFAETTAWHASPALLVLLTVACFGLVALVTCTPLAACRAGWLTVAGALTYPLYLVHENLGWYVIHLLRDRLGPAASVLLATAVALVTAWILYRFVEKPFGPRLKVATARMLERARRDEVVATPARPAEDRLPVHTRARTATRLRIGAHGLRTAEDGSPTAAFPEAMPPPVPRQATGVPTLHP
jgi:peptidoglycan/LPS O-acetylase OafA/YrhL